VLLKIDKVNFHPVKCDHLCETELNVDAPSLEQYINNREQIIQDLLKLNPDETRDTVKQTLLSIANGGVSDYIGILKTNGHRTTPYNKRGLPKTVYRVCCRGQTQFVALTTYANIRGEKLDV